MPKIKTRLDGPSAPAVNVRASSLLHPMAVKSRIFRKLSANISQEDEDEEDGEHQEDVPVKSAENGTSFKLTLFPGQSDAFPTFSPPWKKIKAPWRLLPDEEDASLDDANQSRKRVKIVKPKKLRPFKRGLPEIEIDEVVETALADKGIWRSQQYDADTAIAQGVLDVDASPQVVWNQLFDFATYIGKVPVFCLADVYRREVQSASQVGEEKQSEAAGSNWMHSPLKLFRQVIGDHPEPGILWFFGKVFGAYASPMDVTDGDDTDDTRARISENEIERIFVKYQSQVIPGIRLTCHCDHTYEPAKNSVTWECDDDYKKQNSVDEVQGHWHVEPHPDGSTKSRVFYEIALLIPGWIPRWIIDQLSKNVVKEATDWVKTESERAAVRPPSVQYQTPSPEPATTNATLPLPQGLPNPEPDVNSTVEPQDTTPEPQTDLGQ